MKTFDWILLAVSLLAIILWYIRLIWLTSKYPDFIIDMAWKSKQITFRVPAIFFISVMFILYRVYG